MLSLPLTDVDHALRPGTVTVAAVLAITQAGMTAIASAVFAMALVWDNPWQPAAIVFLAQVTGVALLVVGAVRLFLGGGRAALVAGAALELVICAFYLVYPIVVLPDDPNGNAAEVIVPAVLGLAVLPVIVLGLAVTGRTAEYLRFIGRETRYPPG
jgi:hypothetical protein